MPHQEELEEEKDLLFAFRGAGSSFGIITKILYQVRHIVKRFSTRGCKNFCAQVLASCIMSQCYCLLVLVRET